MTSNFQHSVILLEEARNIRFAKFVAPGDQLIVEVQWNKENGDRVELTGKGSVGEETVIAAKLTLRQKNLAAENPKLAAQDTALKNYYRSLFSQIYQSAGAMV